MNFYMPGNFRTRVHFEKRDMAVESNMPCLVLKSLDGHETGRQATDLDENFGASMVFYGNLENRNPEADFGLPQIENSTFHLFAKLFARTFFPSESVCENCRGVFVCENCPGGVLNISPWAILKTNYSIGIRHGGGVQNSGPHGLTPIGLAFARLPPFAGGGRSGAPGPRSPSR